LSVTETGKMFGFMRQVRSSGRSIVFVGHNIHHVYDIANRFVVLDRGKVELAADRRDVPSAEVLIGFMEAIAKPNSSADRHGPIR